ncbi:hypothetical protein IW150_000526 [Coemansia sp. RSA 2607]|nr:hypothetical protein IW150_000526 [Coemansia sp. RSA 2607]
MNALKHTLRRYTTKPQLPTSFLEPNISPLGSWSDAPLPTPPPKRATTPWSLAERRALLLYTRAISVHKQQDPSWQHIGQTLDRTPLHCRFIATTMVNAWKKHNPQKSKQDAGVNTDMLLKLSRGEQPEGALKEFDSETVEWLRKLVATPEQVLLRPEIDSSGKKRRWTTEECEMLKDHCGLYRYPSAEDMAEVIATHHRPLVQLREKYLRLRNAYAKKRGEQEPRPFDEAELEVIRQAAERRSPQMIRWMDVKDGLKGRTFEEVVHLTQPRRVRYSIKPKKEDVS